MHACYDALRCCSAAACMPPSAQAGAVLHAPSHTCDLSHAKCMQAARIMTKTCTLPDALPSLPTVR